MSRGISISLRFISITGFALYKKIRTSVFTCKHDTEVLIFCPRLIANVEKKFEKPENTPCKV